MKAENMACLVLASGLSERFGESNKLQAELGGQTVLSHILNTVKSAGFGETFIVSQKTSFTDLTVVLNDNPKAGQGHALRLGVTAMLDAGWSRAMVVLGDMPLIRTSHLKDMVAVFDGDIAMVSLSGGRKLPPAIFAKSALEQIIAQTSDIGAKVIFDQLTPATFPLDADSALDVDTPQDLARVATIMESRST